MKTSENAKYERAAKKVEDIKKFYRHLHVYLIINFILLLVKANVLGLLSGDGFEDLAFERWLDINVYGTAFLWGIGLAIHGLYVFQYKFKFLKNWEARKIEQLMNDNDENL